MNEQELLKLSCSVLELEYLNSFGFDLTEEGINKAFNNNWILSPEYKLKLKILTEALEKKIPITDVELYQTLISDCFIR